MPTTTTTPATTTAADLTFGVEIECTVPMSINLAVGPAHRGYQVPELPIGWTAQSDASIDASNGRRGVEIVSPILKGAEGIRQVLTVLAWLRDKGAKVNASCGLHIHVGFNATWTAELGRVVALVARHEKGLYAATGTTRRETGSFSRPIARDGKYTRNFKDGQPKPIRETEFNTGSSVYPYERYHSLNLTGIGSGRKPTVEFRLFSATLQDVKMVGFIRLALGIVEKALRIKRTPPWELNARPKRRGAGLSAVTWLMRDLGWKSGATATKYGMIEGEGIPDNKTCRYELSRLAKQYDAQSDASAAARIAV